MSIQPPWGAVPKNGRPPVIVVHAITGSALVDEYPLPAEVVWDLSLRLTHPVPTRDFLRIAPHPDDTRFEAVEPARIQSSQILNIIYGDLVEALRYDLSERQEPTPVFPFHYDWRQDNTLTAKQLGDFIREVIERTNLLKHYGRSCGCVDLVGHSMGGLVIAACLGLGHHLENGKRLVRRVVTLATPFRGSVDALEKVSTGESTLVGLGSNRERETARITPAIYQLLPSYEQGFVRDAKPINIYDAGNWQSTIIDSLREFIRAYSTEPDLAGLSNEALLGQGRGLLQNLLTMGQALHDLVEALNPEEALLDSWRLLVGIDSSTLYQATTEGPDNRFRFERIEGDFDPDKLSDSQREKLGDETVPLRGAIPSWAEPAKVICVRGDDFSALEIRDRFIREAVGLHASLPLMNLVQRWVISFLRGTKTGDLWGRPLPGVTRWDPGFPGVVNKAAR